MNILDLNEDALQAILSRLSFDDIAKIRLVCSRFNKTCQTLLNKGFAAVQLYNKKCQKEIKAMLPRRDSEREIHPLAQHLDVLKEMEFSFFFTLSCRYRNKPLQGVSISFIPGKVLDESYRVLGEVMDKKQTSLVSDELLDNLRDLTYTAKNHFDEHIRPAIKRKKKCSIKKHNPSPTTLSKLTKENRPVIDSQRKKISELESKVLKQEKELADLKQKFIQLEVHLGINLSQKSTYSPTLSNQPEASTSTTTHQQQMSKRSLQDDGEQRPRKRLQPEQENYSSSL